MIIPAAIDRMFSGKKEQSARRPDLCEPKSAGSLLFVLRRRRARRVQTAWRQEAMYLQHASRSLYVLAR
jgi:hypothetical protein